MKTLKTIIPIGILLFTCLFAMGEKKQKSDTAGIAKIEQLMKNREFYIEVDQAFPTGNSSITINSKYGQKRIGGEGYVSLATNEGQLFILDTVASCHSSDGPTPQNTDKAAESNSRKQRSKTNHSR